MPKISAPMTVATKSENQDRRLGIPIESGNAFVTAYSLVKRSGILGTRIGRRLFKSSYFLYKRYIEDDLLALVRYYPALVRGGDVLDIGANIGYTATVLARAADPGRRVYAFEPEPSNFKVLEETAHESGFESKIIPLKFAVGAGTGAASLWVNDRHHGDHKIITERFRSTHPASKEISVSLVSVDSFLYGERRDISFVKVDVEGYEMAVCQGMTDTLEQNPGIAIFLEFMPPAMRGLGFEPSNLIEFFRVREFKLYVVHSGGRLSQGMPPVIRGSGYVNLLFSRHTLQGTQ